MGNASGALVLLSRNMIELGGRRNSDQQIMNANSAGIRGIVSAEIDRARNIVRNHSAYGINAVATGAGIDLAGDYVCGNTTRGVLLTAVGSAAATATGITAAYNTGNGVEVDDFISSSGLTFNNDSAFTANGSCGFLNSNAVTVSATNNQWRSSTGGSLEPPSLCSASTDRCTGAGVGAVTCDPVQGAQNALVVLDGGAPIVPTNVVLKGQTLRVQGTGFNAIHGNPLYTAASCNLGNDISSAGCCRKPSKANVCVTGSQPDPPADGSNCVALLNGVGQWKHLSVTSVTPTTIVAEIPAVGFSCLGKSGERVRVVKFDSVGGKSAGFADYCVNPL